MVLSKRTTNDEKKYVYRFVGNFGLILIAWASFACMWYMLFNPMQEKAYENKGNILILTMYALLLCVSMHVMRAYGLCVERITNVSISTTIALLMNNILNCFIVVLVTSNTGVILRVIGWFILLWILQSVVIVWYIGILTNRYAVTFPPHRILNVYGEHKNSLPMKMNERAEKYVVAASISCEEPLENIFAEIVKYDAVLLNDIQVDVRNKLVKFCYENNIRVYTTPKLSDIILRGSSELNLFDSPLYLCRNNGLSLYQRLWKRVLDIIVSLVILILTSPILLITAIAIKLNDGGSVFYKQLRYTIDKKTFWILKFRSMIENAEADGKANPAASDDDRITKVGKIIRATRIDELPQLINILKGEMSFVGPRAERVEHVDKYCQEIPEFAYRMKVKAGLTGYAQIHGKYNTSAYDKLKLDLIYITNYSLVQDLQIIAQTLRVVFTKESTEGFDEEQKKSIQG